MSAYEVVRMYICMWYVDCVYSNLALQDIFLSMLVRFWWSQGWEDWTYPYSPLCPPRSNRRHSLRHSQQKLSFGGTCNEVNCGVLSIVPGTLGPYTKVLWDRQEQTLLFPDNFGEIYSCQLLRKWQFARTQGWPGIQA